MVSFPIPSYSRQRYAQLDSPLGFMGPLVQALSGSQVRERSPAHLDPDLWADTLPRPAGWRASLGQCGSAQSHLEAQDVGPGDVLLFFGWFRRIEPFGDTWRYVRGARDRHVLFGYLQIGESVLLGPDPQVRDLADRHAFLSEHAHLHGQRRANNTVHLAADTLVLDGRDTGLPGGGAFERWHPLLDLSAEESATKSLWRLPAWAGPREGKGRLSYHTDAQRWREEPERGTVTLQTVAKGQEFVLDVGQDPSALGWVEQLVRGSKQAAS